MDKKRHVATWLRMLATKEIATARFAKNLLKAQGTKIVNAFEKGGQLAAFKAVQQTETEWVRLLVPIYTKNITDFRQYVQEQLGFKKNKSRYLDNAKQWVSSQAYFKSRYLTATTHDIVKRVVSHGLENGLNEKEIAKNIKGQFDSEISAHRARTIARTEVHNSASFGMQNGAEESELNLTREWVSVGDERTRDAHSEADGQERGMDEPFDVDGEQVDYPGDGSAENSINCRCTIIYNQADTSFAGTSEGNNDFGSGESIGEFE